MKWLKNRLKERSTWRGLSIMAGVLGVGVDPALIQEIGVGVGAAIAVTESVIPETAG